MTTREIPHDIAANAHRAQELQADAKAKLDEVSRLNRAAVTQLLGSGWKQADIADILGLSGQRVSQLVKALKRGGPQA